MKKLFIVSVAAMMMLGILSCGGSGGGDDVEYESCLDSGTCFKTGTTVKTCCRVSSNHASDQCWYWVDGKRFECKGTSSCEAAVNQVVAYCYGYASDLKEILKSVQQKIIVEERCTDNRQIDE